MTNRIEDETVLPGIHKPMFALGAHLQQSNIEEHLLHLLSMRVSQINGCAYCLAMHARDLRHVGEREDRIAVLSAWRETTWFTERERAALAWAEALTTLPNREVPDAVFELARGQFSEKDLADLTLEVIAINGWNRINIAFHTPPEPYTIDTSEAVAAD
ncbi:MAG: carboxymuconolactone decarboxylase family protein [Chloroflexota bacterium]|nr:carboxymuconolactone decarboxylase family protein [Chloroflexota bacterium]